MDLEKIIQNKNLDEINLNKALAIFLGVKPNQSSIRRGLVEQEYMSPDMPAGHDISHGPHLSSYIDHDVVREEKAKENFKKHIVETYATLDEIGAIQALATFLGVKNNSRSIRRGLVEQKYMSPDMPAGHSIRIGGKHLSSYIDHDVVGEEKAKENFRKYITETYITLDEIGRDSGALASFLGVKRNQSSIRRGLVEQKYMSPDMPAGHSTSYGRSELSSYINRNIVGKEKAEENFRKHITETYSTLDEVIRNQALATFLGVKNNPRAIRKALVEKGYFSKPLIDTKKLKMIGVDNVNVKITLRGGIAVDFSPLAGIISENSSTITTDSNIARVASKTKVEKKQIKPSEAQKLRFMMGKNPDWDRIASFYAENFKNIAPYVITLLGAERLVSLIKAEGKEFGLWASLASGPSEFYNAMNDLGGLLSSHNSNAPKIIDCDLSPEMLKYGKNSRKVRGDLAKLCFKQGSLDGIECSSFYQFTDPNSVYESLVEATQALKLGGILYLPGNKPFSSKFLEGIEKMGYQVYESGRLRISKSLTEKCKSRFGSDFTSRVVGAARTGYILIAQKTETVDEKTLKEIPANSFQFPKKSLAVGAHQLVDFYKTFSEYNDEKCNEYFNELCTRIRNLPDNDYSSFLLNLLSHTLDIFLPSERAKKPSEDSQKYIARMVGMIDGAIEIAPEDKVWVNYFNGLKQVCKTIEERIDN